MTKVNVRHAGIIIGAGLSGLAQGLFLQQYGIDLPIYEQATSIDDGHHLIWLAPNGLELLADLELIYEVKRHAVAQKEMSFTDRKLRMVNQLRESSLRSKTGETILAIRRCDLHQILISAFKQRGGSIKLGQRIQRFEHTSDALLIHMQDSETRRVQYAIAADGIGSATRAQLFPESAIEYQGIRTWLGHSACKNASQYIGRTLEAWGHGCRFVMTSLDGKSVYWSALERPETYESNNAPIPDDLSERLQQVFSGFHDDVIESLQSLDRSQVKRCNFGIVEGMPDYARGRLCLIGDAAHGMPPNMGQGASLGFEDAFWVAKHIAKHKQGVPPKFSGFYKERKSKVSQAMKMANSMNTLFQPKTLMASKARNIFFAALPRWLNEQGAIAFYKKPIEGGIRLPKVLEKPSFLMLSLFTKLTLLILNARFKIETLQEQHCEQAAILLAEEFERREPLCKTLDIPLSEIRPFFREMVEFNCQKGLSLVATDKNGQVVACISNDEHTDPFIPLKHEPSEKLQLIHDLLEQHPIPQSFDASEARIFNAGLVAIKSKVGRNQLLPLLMYESGRRLHQKGFRIGYAKITNPAVVRSLNQLDRALPRRMFKLRSKIWPRDSDISGQKPFAMYDKPIYLFSWQLRGLV